MAMRASAHKSGTTSKPNDSLGTHDMLAMAGVSDMHMAMEMSDIDGKEIVTAGGAKLALFRRFSGWPELKEAMMSGKVEAAYLLAPMAMDLADNGVPMKIVALGHRSGAVIMVNSHS